MRRLVAALALAGTAASLAAHPARAKITPEAAKVVRRYVEVTGGAAAFAAESTSYTHAKIFAFGFEGAYARGHRTLPFPEIAGPREESLVEAAQLFASRRGDPVRVEGVSDPADPVTFLAESGGLLPGPDAKLAGPTFEEWLEISVPAASRS